MQSHLLGASELYVGFVSPNGILQRCESRSVRDMTRAQDKIDWGGRVLNQLKDYCSASPAVDGALKVWRVQARKGTVDIRELTTREVADLNRRGVPRNGIIPVSFIKGLDEKSIV
jgi:hypothetical protein